MIGRFGNWCARLCGVFAAIIALSPALAAAAGPSNGLPADLEKAPVVLLVDVSSGQVLHARNPSRRFVPASVTKTMTAFVAFELIKSGRLDLARVLPVAPEAYDEWNGKGSTMWLDTETPARVEDLLTGIMTVSANDGSIVLAQGAAGSVEQWTALMNEKARELDMTGSHFGTPNGWPDEGRTFTTARDLVKLADAMIRRHPDLFARFIGQREFRWNNITQSNRDPLLAGGVEGADGIKTGFTREAGFSFLGTVKRGRQRLVVVLAGVPSGPTRDKIARGLIEWGFSAFDRKSLYSKGEYVGDARVQNGSARRIGLVTDRIVRVNIPKGRMGEMTAEIQYDGPVRAPIKAGERVATLEITVPGMQPARVPLMAQEDVGEAGPFGRLWNGLTGWLW